MATTTTKLGLHKPAQSDHPNASAADLATDMQTLDDALDTDGTLAANSDAKFASQKAAKTYADTKIAKALFDANTVLAATTDDTPAAITMGASTILARLAAGNIKAATPAELRTLLGQHPASEATYFSQLRRVAGDLTLSGTAWADVPTIADRSVTAVTGDWIEYGVNFLCGTGGSTTTSFDVVTIVSAAVVNTVGVSAGASDSGCPGWFTLSGNQRVAGSVWYQVQAGDISGGAVALRLRYINSTATTRPIYADANAPAFFWARNHG